MREVQAEIATYDEIIQRYNPLLFVQLALLIAELVLFFVVHLAIMNVFVMPWLEFGIAWGSITLILFLVQWWVYRSWERACRIQKPGNNEYDRGITYIVGLGMISQVQKGTAGAAFLFYFQIYVLITFLAFSDDFVVSVDHSIQIPSLLLMAILSFLSSVALSISMVAQFWPLAHISDVVANISTR